MIIPHQSLTPATLDNIIEAFILREGTDYGESDVSLDDKIVQLKQQLAQNQIVLVYSEHHQTVNILPAEQFSSNQMTIE